MQRKCWICGKPATAYPSAKIEKYFSNPFENCPGDEKSHRAFCEECAQKWQKQLSEDKKEYLRLKKLLMRERAVKILERQSIDIEEYRDAIIAVSEFSEEHLEKFDSSHEMVAAIILINNEIETKVQANVGKYRVDFLLPTLKAVLEVDGDRHEGRVYYDNNRDKEIRSILGGQFEVVRVKTQYIEQNAKMLIDAIRTIRAEKQAIRLQCNGELPGWYHRRERKPKKQDYGDELLL